MPHVDDALAPAVPAAPDTNAAGSCIDALAPALVHGDVRRFLTVPGSPATRLTDALSARGVEVIDAHDEKTTIETALGLAIVGVRGGVIAKGSGGLVLAEALQNPGPHEIAGRPSGHDQVYQRRPVADVVLPGAPARVVAEADITWADLGTWSTTFDSVPCDAARNRMTGPVATIVTEGCVVVSTDRPVTVIGLEDVLVAATPEGVVVCSRSHLSLLDELASDR